MFDNTGKNLVGGLITILLSNRRQAIDFKQQDRQRLAFNGRRSVTIDRNLVRILPAQQRDRTFGGL